MAKTQKSEADWQRDLSPEQFYVCRQKGTERAFSGAFWNTKDKGVYRCACCNAELFKSDAKFDSGTGWPSFFAPAAKDSVATEKDKSHGMVRTEATCSSCGAHLGHVFPDGPAPTGLRFCINSVSLKLEKETTRG